jgi:hypothetical protein
MTAQGGEVTTGQRRSDWLQGTLVLIAILAVFLFAIAEPRLSAQVRRGSLSGTVVDPTGAVIPGAEIALKSEATGVAATTVANGSGYFYFASVEPGSYTVTVTAQGFSGWEAKGITFNQFENRTLPAITLKLGASSEKVEVNAADELVPLSTSESRQTITSQMLPEMAIQGRNASELIKIMPGMAMNSGLGQSQYTSLTTQTNSGPIGSYSASGGQPYGGLSMTTDGVQIVDPGNQGTQTANINQDMTQEVTILNATYGAEAAKGPVTFQAIGKSGGKDFHGSGYLYTRNGAFNANDWWLNSRGVQPPADSYYYPGGTLGGPVIIPGTSFNKNRDKLFFFTAFEYMKQQPVGSLVENFIPTPEMLGGADPADCAANGISGPCGNFSSAYLTSLGLAKNNFDGTGQAPCDPGQASQWWYGKTDGTSDHYCGTTAEGIDLSTHGGFVPVSIMDPNALALISSMPKANRTPTADQPENFQYLSNTPVNRWEYRARIDYNMTRSTKISGSYTWQNEKDLNPIGVWWWPPNSIPYPTQMGTPQKSRTANVSVTTVFTPTLTNDFTFGYAYFINPFQPASTKGMDPATYGYTAHGPFDANILPQLPDMTSWGGCGGSATTSCMPVYYAPAFPKTGWANNAFGKDSKVPSISDNVAKVIGTHSIKAGFYWDTNTNNQTEGYGDFAQGSYDFDNYNNNTSGNAMADMVLGHGGYTQKEHIPINLQKYHQVSFYLQDQWKAMRKLTLTYGLRFDHEGQWFVDNGLGISVWNPALYNPSTDDSPQWTGLTWHGATKSVPLSGWTSPTFYYAPRVGAAYDVFGNGKTVLRGGFGVYRWQVSGNDIGGGQDQPQGIRNTTCSGGALNKMAEAAGCAAATFNPGNAANGSISVLQLGDNKTPYTQNWSFIISQAVPWKSTLELQYQGNRTRNALLAGNGTNIQFFPNINKIPLGALYGPDPINGTNAWQTSCAGGLYNCGVPSGAALVNYFPYRNYDQALIVNTHGSYSNYNAFMASWQKQRGPVTFMANYTFSKVMGIRDGQTNNGNGDGQINDSYNLTNNYAPLGYDHTHIFNIAYVLHLPSPIHGNPFLSRMVNGWEFSGISQVQSGAPIQPNTNGNLNATYDASANAIFGTSGQRALPILLCDPRTGLKSGQYFNPNCFTSPIPAGQNGIGGTLIPGKNGQPVWPYIHGPAYLNHDLSLYKNFAITETKSIQFRMNAFNFLNHPLPQFNLVSDVNLHFSGLTSSHSSPEGISNGMGGWTVPTVCSLDVITVDKTDPNDPITHHTNPECNSNADTNGKPFGKVGRRVMEFAVKFTF